MGRKDPNADECQARNYDIHDAVPLLVGATLESVLFPEFFVRSGKVFRGNRAGQARRTNHAGAPGLIKAGSSRSPRRCDFDCLGRAIAGGGHDINQWGDCMSDEDEQARLTRLASLVRLPPAQLARHVVRPLDPPAGRLPDRWVIPSACREVFAITDGLNLFSADPLHAFRLW